MDSEDKTTRLSTREQPWVSLNRIAQRVAIGLSIDSDVPPSCPDCFGTGMAILPDEGAKRCHCEIERVRVETLSLALSKIPYRYKDAELSTLKPRIDLHPKQSEIVEYMPGHLEDNYFLCGRPDSGKTHFYWTLYRDRAVRGVPVFASKLFDLIEGIKAHMFNGAPSPLPALDVPRISIFLEDVNKARPTEFVAERFFNFLDDIYNRQHQIVVTSQISPEDLIKYFHKVDDQGVTVVDGSAIVRRMKNDETAIFRLF